MNDLLGLLMKQLGGNAANKLSEAIGTDQANVKKGIDMALPLILNQLSKKSQSDEGSKGIIKALDKHIDQDNDGDIDLEDGMKILGHLFGDKKDTLPQQVAEQTGLDGDGAMKLLAGVANKVMGGLGQKKKEGGLDMTNLVGLLSTNSKKATDQSSFANNLIYRMLDQDGDGSIVDDAMRIGGDLLKKMIS